MDKVVGALFRYASFGLILLSAIGSATADFKDTLASRLSADPTYLIVNLPPRPDAWPGAIFTWNMRIPIKHGDPNDPTLRRGSPITIDATDAMDGSTNAKGGYAGWLGLSAAATDVATVSMELPNATIVDMELADLIKHIKASPEAIAAAKRGQSPVVIVKSYEATPKITLTKKSGASAAAWAELQQETKIGADGHIALGDIITYTSKQPIVIAFETQQVDFDLADLSNDVINVKLASLPTQLFAFRESQTDPVLSATIGISVDDLKREGILGGEASVFHRPFRPPF